MPAYLNKALHFLSRMSTAVGVLCVLAVFSVIGTLIPQARGPQFYEALYGPNWADLIQRLSLDNVYAAWWFLGCALFLVLSVSVCLTRNGPRLYKQLRAPKAAPNKAYLQQWSLIKTTKRPIKTVVAGLKKQGFTAKKEYADGSTMLVKGVGGRFGYFFTHMAVVLLSVAAVLTGLGGYRLTLQLVEGQSLNIAALWKDGRFQVADLPFTLTNKQVEVVHYATGKPSQFKTTLDVTYNGQTTTHEIEVNKPLSVAGHRIYQADYGDGGSLVTFALRDLKTGKLGEITYQGHTKHEQNILTDKPGFELVPETLAPHTIVEVEEEGVSKMDNLGPSVELRLTTPTQTPLRLQVFLTKPWIYGASRGPNQPFDYYNIGLDSADDDLWPTVAQLLNMLPTPWPQDPEELNQLLMLNMRKIAAEQMADLDPEQRLRRSLMVLIAATNMTMLGLPVFPVLKDAQFTPYTGLIIAHDPGMWLFVLGGLLMVIGIGFMLYFPFCKVWVLPNGQKEGTFVAAQASKVHALPKTL